VTLARSSKPLPFRSAKRAAIADERRAFVARILSERPTCEGLSYLRRIVHEPGERDQRVTVNAMRACTLYSAEVHERRKRSRGGSIVDDANVACLCSSCHRFTESEPRLSTLAGLLIPSWEKP
jgi:hypothetical protein